MQILTHKQIGQKIKRLAIQILERNVAEPTIVIAGINNNGLQLAQLILKELVTLTEKAIILTRISANAANPIESEVLLEMPLTQLDGQTIILIDDVANSGRTLFYATKPLLNILPRKIETVVLVDRKHKSFPIEVNYHGLSLATTFQENIRVSLKEEGNFGAFLE